MLQDAQDDSILEIAQHYELVQTTEETKLLPSSWKAKTFRLFISHLSLHRDVAHEFKDLLLTYGIEAFVAHDDIAPGKEWLDCIFAALDSCHATLVLMHPEWEKSSWVQQEVGYSLGRHILTQPVLFPDSGAPGGLVGKIQGTKCKGIPACVKDILKVLINDKKTASILTEALVSSFENSGSFEQSKAIITILGDSVPLNPNQLQRLFNATENNGQVKRAFGVVDKVKAIFLRLDFVPQLSIEEEFDPFADD